MDPPVRYCVAGLDPALDRSQAKAYRASLLTLANELGIADKVEWQIGPLHAERLSDLAQRADLIRLLQSPADRTASAILDDAITAARPIVANGSPYATEILPDTGGGIVATEPATIADGLIRIVTNQRLCTNMPTATRRWHRLWTGRWRPGDTASWSTCCYAGQRATDR